MLDSIMSFLLSFFTTNQLDSSGLKVNQTAPSVINETIEPPAESEVLELPELPTKEVIIKGENHPLSMKTFMDQNFEGTDFKIGNLLNDWGTHKSYYATHISNGLKISGTWHVPNGEGPFPLLILNHGYFPPETYTNGYGFGREQKYFARNGYAVFHTDYRGYAFSDKDPLAHSGRRFGYTGYSADAINAIVSIKAANLPYVDTKRVGLLGHSMGGGVTLNAALARPDLIDAAVLWGPVSSDTYDNFKKWTEARLNQEGKEVFESAFGSIDNRESFKAVSARTYLSDLTVPLLIQQGTADESCPVEWARATEAELTALNKDFAYIEYEDYPHVFWDAQWDRAAANALEYLNENVKEKP